MSKSKRPPQRTSHRLKDAKLRAPGSLPSAVQWKLEGDAEFIKTLDGPTAIWMAAFLEAELGDNPQVLDYDQARSREVWRRSKANDRDVMTICRGRNRVDLDDYVNNLVPDPLPTETPSKLQQREKLHPALVTGGPTNPTEDAVIDAIDMNVAKQRPLPLTKREAAAARKERIKARLKRIPAK